MTRDDVQAWLDRYVAAWESYDPSAVGDLFADDAHYRYHPADEPIVGRDAIVRSWVEPDGDASTRDAPGTYAAHYEPFAVDGARAVAVGWSRYWTDASRAVERTTYDNCFLLEFDVAGRCRSFTEFFRERPAAGS
jgi:SnoaL-like domain